MNILALDTSMGACSAALITRDGGARRVFARAERMARGHAEALMPMVDDIMGESGTAFGALDRIAATTGPGSFTGVRIAISAARGLALVTAAKLFGSDSLTVMATRGARSWRHRRRARSPSRSMRGAACSISASTTRPHAGATARS